MLIHALEADAVWRTLASRAHAEAGALSRTVAIGG